MCLRARAAVSSGRFVFGHVQVSGCRIDRGGFVCERADRAPGARASSSGASRTPHIAPSYSSQLSQVPRGCLAAGAVAARVGTNAARTGDVSRRVETDRAGTSARGDLAVRHVDVAAAAGCKGYAPVGTVVPGVARVADAGACPRDHARRKTSGQHAAVRFGRPKCAVRVRPTDRRQLMRRRRG
jgi:hypothetical protein